jgi:hypothetical protein
MGTCHQCAALAGDLAQARAELAAAQAKIANLTPPISAMQRERGMTLGQLVNSLRDELAATKKDALRFNALRRIRSFHGGVFLLADYDSEQEIVAVPTETICYSVFAKGCDERDAVDNAIKIMRAEQEAALGTEARSE